MTFEIGLVLAILVVAVVLFVTERVRVDVVALMVLVTLALTGLLTPDQAVSGFSNPAVVTVWAVFILSGGLSRTGVAGILGRQVLRLSGGSEGRLVMVIMLTAAFLSAFMNNVGVAALLLPVVMDISRRTRHPPSKLLIPLAFSSLLGGLVTLIGTPPNILVSAALDEHGLEPFEMFDFTPVGAGVVLAGIAYMSLVGRRLLPTRNPAREMAVGEEVDFDQVYSLRERLFALDVPEGSPLAGKSLAESRVGSALGLNVMGILRDGHLELAPEPSVVFETGDRLVVQGQLDALKEVGVSEYLSLDSEPVTADALVSEAVGLAELSLPTRSKLFGKTLREIDFRRRFGVIILALWRDDAPVRTHLASTELAPGDVLLVHGERQHLDKLDRGAEFAVTDPDTSKTYHLEDRLMSVRVPPDSPLVGKTLAESRLGDVFSLGVMGIVRGGETLLIPPADELLEAGDRLLVKGKREDLQTAEGLHELPIDTDVTPDLGDLESDRVGLAEAVLAPRSSVAGKTLPQIHFREKYGFNVVAVMREGKAYGTYGTSASSLATRCCCTGRARSSRSSAATRTSWSLPKRRRIRRRSPRPRWRR